MTVFITFTTIGADAGPFNLYSDVDGYSSAFEVGVTSVQLLTGFPSASVPSGTTIIRAKSFGVCTNFVDLPLIPAPPTTTTTTLPPVTTTSTTAVPTTSTTTTQLPGFTLLAYSGTNSLRNSGNSSFNATRTAVTGNGSSVGNWVCGSWLNAGTWFFHRAYFGFNTTAITAATAANITLNITTNQLPVNTQFVLARINSAFPANHPWVLADFDEGLSGIIIGTPTLVNTAYTGSMVFPLNAAGLSYINANNASSFALLEYTSDFLNNAGAISLVNNSNIIGTNASVTLNYS